jgi:hypothetical protein
MAEPQTIKEIVALVFQIRRDAKRARAQLSEMMLRLVGIGDRQYLHHLDAVINDMIGGLQFDSLEDHLSELKALGRSWSKQTHKESKMSKPNVIVNSGSGSDLDRFDSHVSDRAAVDRALQKRDAANREQNDAARSGRPVGRDN